MAFSANLISFDPTLVLPTPFLCLSGSTSASSTPFPPSHHRCVHYDPPLPSSLKACFGLSSCAQSSVLARPRSEQMLLWQECVKVGHKSFSALLLPICWQHGQQISLLSFAVLLAVQRINILNIM